tara:strand:+ start:754 stop:1101 length:348 start_codon:yes stop_codon:yes gene_type:complete
MGLLARLGLKGITNIGKRLGLKGVKSAVNRVGKKAVKQASTQIVKHQLKDKAIDFGKKQAITHGGAFAEQQGKKIADKVFSKRKQIQRVVQDTGNDPAVKQSIRQARDTASLFGF